MHVSIWIRQLMNPFLRVLPRQALSSDSVLVGLATDALTSHKQGADTIKPFEARRDAVLQFLAAVKPGLRGMPACLSVVLVLYGFGPRLRLTCVRPVADVLLCSVQRVCGCVLLLHVGVVCRRLVSVDVVPLEDAAGPAATDPQLDGLLVSSETLASGRRVNAARVKKGLPPLTVLVIRRTQQASLSSTALRNSR